MHAYVICKFTRAQKVSRLMEGHFLSHILFQFISVGTSRLGWLMSYNYLLLYLADHGGCWDKFFHKVPMFSGFSVTARFVRTPHSVFYDPQSEHFMSSCHPNRQYPVKGFQA